MNQGAGSKYENGQSLNIKTKAAVVDWKKFWKLQGNHEFF